MQRACSAFLLFLTSLELSAQSTATVYRDPNGVPHIEANNERTAWYAVGYEQARDSLLFMQVQHAWLQGRASERFGFQGGTIFGDLVVKVLDTRPSATDLSDFNYQDAHIAGNFVDNVKAFFDGANAYRTLVSTATSGTSPAAVLRSWLESNGMAWVHNTRFDYLDGLSWGRFNKAVLLTALARGKSPGVDPVGFGFQPSSGAQPSSGVTDGIGVFPGPGSDSMTEFLERFNRGLPPLRSVGSNSFAWSQRFILDAGKNYSLCVADPHWGAQRFFLGLSGDPAAPFNYANEVLNGTVSWFAHIKITPPGSTRATLDAFGDIPPGVPHFYLCHNRNVAFGGSQSGPNAADCMLLRLKQDANGDPELPYKYYDYELDTDGDDGGDSSDWVALRSLSMSIQGPGAVLPVSVWRAGRFGFVLPDNSALTTLPVLHGEQWTSTNPWRLGFGEQRNRFYATKQVVGGQVTTWPLIPVLRVPIDEDVGGGEAHHNRLGVALWEMSHARNVIDWGGQFVDHDGGYLSNGVAVDKHGTMIALQAATMPKRGDDAMLQQMPFGPGNSQNYKSYPHKHNAYAYATPMRCRADRFFDWRYESTASHLPVYLTPSTIINEDWQPWAYFDPRGIAYPPSIGGYTPSLWFENAGYMNFSNEVLWNMWGNGTRVRYASSQPPVPDPNPFNNVVQVAPGSKLLQDILDQGLMYTQLVVAEEALDRNQALSDALRERLRHFLTGGAQGLPPMTKQEALDLVVTNKVYGDIEYSNTTLPAMNPPYSSYPAPVRQLKEVADNAGLANSPITRARKERRFFSDLWGALNTQGHVLSTHSLPGGQQVSLKQAWVDNSLTLNGVARQVFWYDNGVLRQETMPPGFGLIDFVWNASHIGHGLTTSDATLLSGGDLQAPVALLADWDQATPGRMFHMHADNAAALLLELYRQSFNAHGATYGRKWQRLVDGVASASLESTGWEAFSSYAFPYYQESTYMVRPTDAVIEPPYSAIYSDSQHTVLRATAFGAAEITALVRFFLTLSGDYIDPTKNNNSMSLRNHRFLAGQDLVARKPFFYPLTSGLAAVATMRKLLETEAFIASRLGKQPSLFQDKLVFGDVFRSRFYSYDGTQAFPLVGQPHHPAGDPFQPVDGVATEGGMLRAIQYLPNPGHSAYVADRGLQPQYFGMGGSNLTLVTMFEAVDPFTQLPAGASVESWFFCTPTNSPMDPTRPSYTSTLQPWADNQLIPTHYNNYRTVSGPPAASHVY